MKTCTVIALVTFAVVAALVATSMATNSTWGQKSNNDRMLHREQVIRKSGSRSVITVDVVFPGKYLNNPYLIGEVRAIDHKLKDGGHVKLRKGGPGYRKANLHIKSDRNHGLNYTIEIYGH